MNNINDIVINNDFIRHLVKHSYTLKDLDDIEVFFRDNNTLRLVKKENGLYPAVTTEEEGSVSGYSNTWVRDTIMITNYQLEVGNVITALKTVKTLRDYFQKHRFRFENIIEGKANSDDPMQRPHIRFNGDTLEEIEQKWAHAQNDALGYFLWMFFKLANAKEYKLVDGDYDLFGLFPIYFDAIKYWQDRDSGHWEEARKIECSSIGVVVAALEEMRKYIKNHQSCRFGTIEKPVTTEYIDYLIKKGKIQLDIFLPYESPPDRKADGALLFLIYPLEIVSEEKVREILQVVLQDLKGGYGIKRYLGDSYWCADYKSFLEEEERTVDFSEDMEMRDKMLKPGTEAQWCIFDPIISVIYGKWYQKNYKIEHLKQQIYFFNRSLAQITASDFFLGGGKCPEAYYIEDTKKEVYTPNDHVPLAWTQANLGIAFEYMKRSLNITEK